MPLYNQTAYTAVDIARTLDNINRLTYEKAREDLILQIARMYYLGQSTAEQIGIVRENIGRLRELRDITQAFYDNGMAMEVDLKRVNINLENMQVQYDNAQAMLTQQLNLLKYVMDYPANADIALEPVDTENIRTAELTGLDTNQYELQLLRSQGELAERQKRMISQGYLPSLSLTANWMYSAYTDKAKNWFHSGPSNHWYDSNGIGLTLRIPIFDGLDKRSKLRKAKIDIENIRLNQENMQKNLETQYLNATNDLMNNHRNFVKQKDNYRGGLRSDHRPLPRRHCLDDRSPTGRDAHERGAEQLHQRPLQLPRHQPDPAEADWTNGKPTGIGGDEGTS